MTFKHLFISLLLAILAFAGCKKDEDTTPDPPLATHAILPGEGIKEVRIGNAVQVAIDFFGTPFPINSSANGVYGDPTTSHPTFGDQYAIGITFIYDNAEKVKNIDVEAP